jgi:hypothetical protein
MKAFAVALLSVIVSTTGFASILPTKNVTIATNFMLKTAKSTIDTSGTMIIDPTKPRWVTLVPPKDGIALLGRVAKLEGKIATLEFMVVDTNKTEALQSNSSIVTELGKQAQIAQGPTADEPTMKIAVTVEKTR